MLLRGIAFIWGHAPCCLGANRAPANDWTGGRPIHRSKLIAGSLTGCLLLSSLQAQSLREPQFMSEARPGFDAIYSLDYDHAERIFTALKKAYPQHPAPPLYLATSIFQLNTAQILEQMGETEGAITIYLDVLRNAEEGRPNYDQVPMAAFRYNLGSKLIKMGRLPAAQEQFQKCLEHPRASDHDKALSFLRLGQILDLLGRRGEAVEAYRQVLRIKDIEDSQALARKYLKKPYRG